MRRSFLFVTALALTMASAAAPVLAQGYGANQYQGSNSRYMKPPSVLRPGEIVQRLTAAGWRNVRGLSLHRGTYTATADRQRYTFAPSNRYRSTFTLTINAYNGRVVGTRQINKKD